MGALATLDPHGLRLLRVLLGGGPPMTGRALARVTGISQSTAHRALTRLRDAGLVVAERTPPAVVYRANAEHLAMPALVALIRLEELLRARFAEHVAGWRRRPESMVLYGSVARGQATPASDIDVLAVRPDGIEPDEETWQGQIAELSERVLRWTGRRGPRPAGCRASRTAPSTIAGASAARWRTPASAGPRPWSMPRSSRSGHRQHDPDANLPKRRIAGSVTLDLGPPASPEVCPCFRLPCAASCPTSVRTRACSR